MKPSLKTVAAAAGVSVATVSNAYNKPAQLSAGLRERIFEIAGQQGYSGPDPAARSLRSGHTGAIGVLFTSQLSYAFSNPYCSDMLGGIAEVAEQSRTSMLLMPILPSTVLAQSRDEERRSVQSVRQAVVDGVIADGIDDSHPALQVLLGRGLPLIRSSDWAQGRCVLIDDRAAARSIGEHLRGLGHRDVVVVADVMDDLAKPGVPADETAMYPYGRLRLAGVTDGLGPAAQVTVIAAGRNTFQAGRGAAEQILASPQGHSAIVATTDVLALGILETLRSNGIQPGRDISVTGFDDVAGGDAAGLTTVRQPIRDKGRLMARMLLDPAFTDRRIELPTQLVVRDSTGPAARPLTARPERKD